MEVTINEEISLLDQAKIQAQVLLPVLRSLREELGKQQADRLVREALREWARNLFLEVGESLPGSPREKWQAMFESAIPRIGNDVDIDMLRQDDDGVEFNITGCRYAEFFRKLGEPELGFLLLCEADVHTAEVGAGQVDFKRTQTIMQGAEYCDFRYRLKKSTASE